MVLTSHVAKNTRASGHNELTYYRCSTRDYKKHLSMRFATLVYTGLYTIGKRPSNDKPNFVPSMSIIWGGQKKLLMNKVLKRFYK